MKNRKLLEERLTAKIKTFNANDEVYNKILKELEGKITEGNIASIWGGNKKLIFVEDIDLLLFTQALYNATKIKEINPKDYFTDNEFNDAIHKIIDKSLSKNYIVLKNVEKLSLKGLGDVFKVPFISCYDISEALDNRVVGYNFESQREPEKKIVMGEQILLPKIFDEKVDSISDKLLSNEYVPDEIVWNIVKNGNEKYYYDEEEKTLTIYRVENSSVDLIDGANRSYAAITAVQKAKEKNQIVESGFSLMVTNFTIKKSYDFIIQKNLQTPLSNERVKVLTVTKFNKIAKDINIYENEETNILWSKLGDSIEDLKLSNKITTLETFSDGLENSFKDILDSTNPSIYSDILDYQVNFFNEFFGVYYDKLKDVEQTRKDMVLLDRNMFIFYIHIAKKLYHLRNKTRIWRNKVKEIASEIDFNKSNSDWNTMKTTGQLNKKAKQELINYFDNKIDKILNESENDIVVSNS